LLTVKDSNIYSDKGVFLKTIHCPKKIAYSSLIRKTDKRILCSTCDKNLLNTDNVSEEELIETLTKDKDTCLVINQLNPMFNFTK
jgi:hypothetical protein